VTEKLLWETYPHLWHMAAHGSWPSIRDHGLLSTTANLDRYGVNGARRTAIEAQRRPECVTIQANGLPDAVIRDNKPASDGALLKCLQDNLTPTDWYRILNERTFFWLSKERLKGLLEAKAYRNNPQTILTVDTQSLVTAHAIRIELSPINSGSTIYKPQPRGKDTFLPIKDYDYDAWRKKRGKKKAVAELVVRDAVPDIRNHVVAVHDWTGVMLVEIWRRPGADPAIGPGL
jgi:hypothetical protein